jgi:hypothetical protein
MSLAFGWPTKSWVRHPSRRGDELPVVAPIPSASTKPAIATRNALTDYGMPLEEAERWCDAWSTPRSIRNAIGRL